MLLPGTAPIECATQHKRLKVEPGKITVHRTDNGGLIVERPSFGFEEDLAEVVESLTVALRQSLRQWRQYAEMEEDRDLKTEQSTEAELYRMHLALAERK